MGISLLIADHFGIEKYVINYRYLNKGRIIKKILPVPGIEPGFVRPQRTVLTTIIGRLLIFKSRMDSYDGQ